MKLYDLRNQLDTVNQLPGEERARLFAISPVHVVDPAPAGEFTLEQKIDIFEAQVLGWQFAQAQALWQTGPHAGLAVLAIVFSYFEMVAKYRAGIGDAQTKQEERAGRGSKYYFCRGVLWVFSASGAFKGRKRDLPAVADLLYEQIRCGLYHRAITGHRTQISGDFPHALLVGIGGHVIEVNPIQLAGALTQHFHAYVSQLRDPSRRMLRARFRRCFPS